METGTEACSSIAERASPWTLKLVFIPLLKLTALHWSHAPPLLSLWDLSSSDFDKHRV